MKEAENIMEHRASTLNFYEHNSYTVIKSNLFCHSQFFSPSSLRVRAFFLCVCEFNVYVFTMDMPTQCHT